MIAVAARRPISFPDLEEYELRSRRLRAFSVAACLAAAPYCIGIGWKVYDSLSPTIVFGGIPDLAFAGVTVAIAAYMNTVFSFVKANGWRQISGRSFFAALFVVFFASACLLAYMRASLVPPAGQQISKLFYGALFFSACTYIVSFVMQLTFLSDECRWARQFQSV